MQFIGENTLLSTKWQTESNIFILLFICKAVLILYAYLRGNQEY